MRYKAGPGRRPRQSKGQHGRCHCCFTQEIAGVHPSHARRCPASPTVAATSPPHPPQVLALLGANGHKGQDQHGGAVGGQDAAQHQHLGNQRLAAAGGRAVDQVAALRGRLRADLRRMGRGAAVAASSARQGWQAGSNGGVSVQVPAWLRPASRKPAPSPRPSRSARPPVSGTLPASRTGGR